MVSAIIKKTLTGVLKDKRSRYIIREAEKIKSAETGDVKLTPRKNLLKKKRKKIKR